MMILPPQPYPFDDLPEPRDEDEWEEPEFTPGYDTFEVYKMMLELWGNQ